MRKISWRYKSITSGIARIAEAIHTSLLKLVSKSCTALSASSLEDLSAVSSCHSLSETVFLASLSLLRLICSEHNHTSFYIVKKFNDDTGNGHGMPCAQIDNSNYISRGALLSRGNLNFLRDFEEKFKIPDFCLLSMSCWTGGFSRNLREGFVLPDGP